MDLGVYEIEISWLERVTELEAELGLRSLSDLPLHARRGEGQVLDSARMLNNENSAFCQCSDQAQLISFMCLSSVT
jgi:hypothetical protein